MQLQLLPAARGHSFVACSDKQALLVVSPEGPVMPAGHFVNSLLLGSSAARYSDV